MLPRPLRRSSIALILGAGMVFAEGPGSSQERPAPAPADIERRVDALLGQMTLEEKVDLLGGVDGFFIRGVPRLNLPRLKMADGPIGVRNFGPATAMAAGIALAATWDPVLARRVGAEIGRDARAKGVHFLLAPGVNIYRAPTNGRNFEYFGEDPFLASRIAVGYIEGVQAQGVSATVKHFLGNNSEFDRRNTDSILDERALREIYLPVFEAAVKEARVGALMDSYNLVGGVHMSQHGAFNSGLLKQEWGFDGIVMSDWNSTYDGVAAANGGLDLEMPSGRFMNRQALLPAIQEGKVTVATLDDKVRRILRTAVRFGWLDRPQTDASIPRYNPRGREVALLAARESLVLLKNAGGLLPLAKERIKSLAIIGPGAHPAQPVGGGSARVQPFTAVSFLEGLASQAGTGATVYYHAGLPTSTEMAAATSLVTAPVDGQPGVRAEYFSNAELQGPPVVVRTEPRLDFAGTGSGSAPSPPPPSGAAREASPAASMTEPWLSARWTGYYVAQAPGAHDLFAQVPVEDARYRVYLDDQLVLDAWSHALARLSYRTVPLEAGPHKVVLEHFRRRGTGEPRVRLGIVRRDAAVDAEAKALAARADAVVLAVGFDPDTETEGADRTFRLPPGQEELIQQIAAANKNTIVVVTSGGAVDMAGWLDRVPAVLQAWFPGQEGGTALADVLFGAVNPSGRLPVTFERREEDNPAYASYYPEAGTNRIIYKEGVFVGYRGYDKAGTRPLFPFGHGLSYTTFAYRNLAILPASAAGVFRVTFDVVNTGQREGAEVAQVYVADPHRDVERPPKELKGFAKVSLRPGETRRLSVALDRRAFSYYDVKGKAWRAEPGVFDVLVGRSADQIELRGQLRLAAEPGP